MALTVGSKIDNEAVDGAFALAVDVRFDNVSGGSGQKVFDLVSADNANNIWFGQIDGTNDLEFVVVKNGVEYRTVAKDAIVEGETVTWRVGVDPDGVMRIAKDTEVIAQGKGVIPADVDRAEYLIGRSSDGADTEFSGFINNLKLANYGNLAELDPSNPESPCAVTGESACLCGLLRPDDERIEGDKGAVRISDTDKEGNGEWSNVSALTIIPIHAIVLPDGKVLSFGSTESGAQGGQYVYSLFDPKTGVEKVLPNTTKADIFCSSMAIDPNTGNVVIMGGDGGTLGTGKLSGTQEVLIFDYKTETIQQAPQGDMQYARYYGTTVTLATGEIMMVGGRDEFYRGATIAEVFNTNTGIRQLSNAEMKSIAVDANGGGPESLDGNYWYPHAFVNSKGQVIVIEADGGDIYRMTTDGAGTVTKVGTTPFADYALNPSVMYDIDKIAMTDSYGGLWTADISNGTANFVKVAQLQIAHTSGSFIPLPDGTIAIIGGAEARNQGNNINTAEKNVLIWDPSNNSITEMAEQNVERLYHSTGMLLPDGSIWSGGGGAPGPLVNTNVEFFNPKYFYGADGKLADRPDIEDAPKNITAGQTFTIKVDDTSDINMMTAVKSGSSTHARNSDARFMKLDYKIIDDHTIEIYTPDNKKMIPGLWTIYAVDKAGIPSEGNLLGVNMATLVKTPPLQQESLKYYAIDDEQINGAFELTVEAQFDDLGAGSWQRVFDFGNGAAKDNILLTQAENGRGMMFAVWKNGVEHKIVAANAIEQGVMAQWKAAVDDNGYMRLWKNGALVAEGQGAVPANVDRIYNYIGDSNWINDKRLVGQVRNLEIENRNPDASTPPKIQVKSAGDVIEGDAGQTGTVDFIFYLSHVTTKDVVAHFNILGSATGPEMVTIPAGQKQVTVSFSYTGDNIKELNELITVEFLKAQNAEIGKIKAASATIKDDDTMPTTNLLINGDLESVQNTSTDFWQAYQNGTLPGWKNAGDDKVEVVKHNGTQGLDLDVSDKADAIYQDIQTEKDRIYTLSFDVIKQTAGTSDFEILWNGKVIALVSPTEVAKFQFKVTGTGGLDRLTFREVAGQNDYTGAYLDNISLVAGDKAPPTTPTDPTNSAPVIDAANTTATGTIYEIDAGATGEKTADVKATGAIAFTDANAGDTHSATVTPNGADYYGEFKITSVAGGKVTWEFKINDSVLDGLDAGESGSQSYDIAISDGKGGTVIQKVTITAFGKGETIVTTPTTPTTNLLINGDLEAVQNTSTDFWQAYQNGTLPGWKNAGDDQVEVVKHNGTQGLDLDVTDKADAIYQEVQTENGKVYTLSFDVIRQAAGTSDFDILWNDQVVASISPTEVAKFQFNVTGTGGLDRLTFREVAGQNDYTGAYLDNISLVAGSNAQPENPSNSAPVIDAANTVAAATIYEIDAGAAGEKTADVKATGAIAFTDANAGDTHTASVVSSVDGYYGEFKITSVANGKVTWEFKINDSVLDVLDEGESGSQSYDIAISDGNGGTVMQTVTITAFGKGETIVTTPTTPTNPTETSYVNGTDGDDLINLAAGQDTAIGSAGNDVIYGQANEVDQMAYAGSVDDYRFTSNADGSINVVKPDGTDTLHNIDGVWFEGDSSWLSVNQLVADDAAVA